MNRNTHSVKILVVGAGFAGIGLGAMLKKNGIDDFLILERSSSVGGTWRDNTYPGVACDVPSQVYSYSFAPNPDWSRVFSPGPEIHSYLKDVVEDHGISRHIRFNSEAVALRWDADEEKWLCETSSGLVRSKILVLACGRLSEPRYPNVAGMTELGSSGVSFMHSARWRGDVELRGKRVAVVGSGASAIQLVPELAKIVDHLTVMQRSAPYIVPRQDRPYTRAETSMFHRVPESMREARETWFWRQEKVYAQRVLSRADVRTARGNALAHLWDQVQDHELRDVLTPSYEIGCKRVLLSDDYYPSLQLPNVDLVDSALASVEKGTLTTIDGRAVAVDAVVFATGFESAQQPYANRVVGERGSTLAEFWADGMRAYDSISVPGFPNLFVMNGPNASLGHNSAVVMIESQIDYILRALSSFDSEVGGVLRVSDEAYQAFSAEIDDLSRETVWLRGGCDSWYRDSGTGKLTLLWPGSAASFRDLSSSFDVSVYRNVIQPETAV